MIDREGAHCDRCSNCFEREGREFIELLESIKDNGWRAFKVGNVWIHHCDSCVEKKQQPSICETANNYWWNEQ